MLRKTIIAIGFLLLIACQVNKKNDDKQNPDLTNEINKDSSYLQYLGIEDLKTSLKSPKIRIWVSFSLIDSGKIIDLKNKFGTWECEFYQYRFNLDNNGKRVLISENKIVGAPKSGWNNFLNQIEEFGIYTLDDSDRKKNYGLCTDVNVISVEMVKDNKYYNYEFPCWDAIENTNQITKVKNVLQFIQQEFGFKVYPLNIKSSDLKELVK